MSGGSLNYLCFAEPGELFDRVREMEEVEQFLTEHGAEDIASDVRRLIEYIKTAQNRIDVLFDQLSDIFRAVEWRMSGYYDDNAVQLVVSQYRRGGDTDATDKPGHR